MSGIMELKNGKGHWFCKCFYIFIYIFYLYSILMIVCPHSSIFELLN